MSTSKSQARPGVSGIRVYGYPTLEKSTLSMLHSDWLSYYQAICYSGEKRRLWTQNNGGWIAFGWIKLFCLDIFDQLVGFY